MTSLSLKSKLLTASAVIFVLLSSASTTILYNAQFRQASAEMDRALTDETLALTALVNSQPDGNFDFEISDSFAAQYVKLKPGSFFQFVDPRSSHVYLATPNAPRLTCQQSNDERSTVIRSGHSRIRYRTTFFIPNVDVDWKGPMDFERKSLCLIVGLDESPFRAAVFHILATTVPLLMGLFGLLATIVIFLAQRIVVDLSSLARTIETADFGGTHEFPELPQAETLEVKTVADKLRELHQQASDVYKEMWLFLGRAAHQIKTPVAAMQATLDVLLRKDRSREELLAGLADVKSATNSLDHLTRKLISSSRVAYHSPPKRESILLSAFFKRQEAAFAPLAKSKDVVVQLHGDSIAEFESDPALVSEIFGNLIENAILYSPPNQRAVVRLAWLSTDHGVKVDVSNIGAGIPDRVLQTLGSPFVRGDERQVYGSGLGLSIVVRALTLLSGSLKIHSDSGQTTVSVTLPTPPGPDIETQRDPEPI